MSRILPPPTSLTDVAVRPVPDAQTSLATLAKSPPAVLRLAAGTVIAATVVGTDETGATLVRSQFGTLALNTRAPLPQGSQINLQIEGHTARSRSVTVVLPQGTPGNAPAAAPDGRGHPPTTPPPAQPSPAGADTGHRPSGPAATARAGSAAPPAQGTAASPPAAILKNAGSFTATATGRPPATPSTAPLATPVEASLRPVLTSGAEPRLFLPGSQVTVRVVELRAPTPQLAPVPTGPQPAGGGASTAPGVSTAPPAASGAPTAPSAASTPPAASGPPAAGPPPGAAPPTATAAPTPVIQPPSAQPAAPPSAALPGPPGTPPATPATGQGPILTATVVGNNRLGQPLMQTPFGELALTAKANLTPGTTARLEVISAVVAAAARVSPQIAHMGIDLSQDWPALKETLTALQQTNPAAASQVMETAIARPGPQFTNDLLFLLAAMRMGDMRSWLGEQANRALASRSAELAARLGDDFSLLARLAGEASTSEWRAFFLPVHDGQAVQQLRVFTRRQKRKDTAGQQDEPATRFIVEFELSQLGPMQLDGLTHEGQFDLIVRSHAPLPQEVRRDVAGIFGRLRRDGDWAGELAFQSVPSFPVSPLEEIEAGHIGVTV